MSLIEPARADFAKGLRVMLRTQFALVMREARMRHGRSRIGYAWALIEPFAVISIMTLVFSGVLAGGRFQPSLAVFFATGFLPFVYFRHASSFIGMSIEANMPLFNYPPVRELDAAVARFVLDSVTSILIATLVLSTMIVLFDLPAPAHPEIMVLAFAGSGLFAFGVGLNLAALQRQFQMTNYVYGLLMTPAFVFSCIFFSLSSVPPMFKSILVWIPVVHAVEGFRLGYYPTYDGHDISLSYLFLSALILIFFGMAQFMLRRRGLL